MTAAIFGLLGVIVGGVITGLADYFLRAADERAQVRAAARLLDSELDGFERQLEWAESQDPTWFMNWPEHELGPRELWNLHQPLMARKLDPDVWAAVELAYTATDLIRGAHAPVNDEEKASARRIAVGSLEAIRLARQVLKKPAQLAGRRPRPQLVRSLP